MSDYTDEDVQAAVDAINAHREWLERWESDSALCIATDVLPAVVPAIVRRAKAEALREAANILTERTEGVGRVGTARFQVRERDIYSLAIEESRAALYRRADEIEGQS